ncbi:MAG: hypothetical protein ACHQT9_02735 [Candidatus Saccharimonadales bacterium]
MSIHRFNMQGVGDLAMFQSEARVAQQHAGVDPEKCMQIVECDSVDEAGATPLNVFLEHIADRKFATPPAHISHLRSHDEAFHFGHVVATHPEIAGMYAVFASAGLAKKETAEWVADVLEGALGSSVYHVFNRIVGNPPNDETIGWGPLTFSAADRAEIVEIERAHTKKIWDIH